MLESVISAGIGGEGGRGQQNSKSAAPKSATLSFEYVAFRLVSQCAGILVSAPLQVSSGSSVHVFHLLRQVLRQLYLCVYCAKTVHTIGLWCAYKSTRKLLGQDTNLYAV